jgi:hypothetical protein
VGCLVVFIIILLIWWAVESPSTFFIGLFIFIGLGIWAVKVDNKRKEVEKQKKLEEDERNNKTFEERKLQYNISNEYPTVNYKKGFAPITKDKKYIWTEDESVFLFPAVAQSKEKDYILYEISMKDIEYYSTQGIVSKETKISGGGGEVGGTSVGGAIVGGVIAGGVGAVIGSRKKGKIDPIKSEVITHDDRETFLNFYIDGVKHSLFFNYEDYTTLLKLMPQKDYNNFVNAQISRGSKSSITEQLMDLADLKEKGILTEDEFNEKKKILLDKIK